jgi:hypothetical protein
MLRLGSLVKGDGFRCAQPILRTGILPLACGWWSLLGAAAFADPQPQDPLDVVKQRPMIFFVAKGEPGACGPGCSEWIAAEGGFDLEVHARFRQFLDSVPRKDLPIFFHSLGGHVGPSLAVGSLLRAHRMRAGVGHTIPFGCRDTLSVDDACRKLMQSGGEFKSRLRESGAICASSCVYAFIGASTRTVAYVARIGVHRHRAIRAREPAGAESDSNGIPDGAVVAGGLRQYVTQMGVDYGLIDLAEQTDHASTRWLSRDDIARYGIATDGVFETRWTSHTRPKIGHLVVKSVTRPSRLNPTEFRTATIEFRCSFLLPGHTSVVVRRDLDPAEAKDGAAVQVMLDDHVILNSARRSAATIDIRATSVPAAAIAQAGASASILLNEIAETWSRETRFSTQGLSDALKSAPEECSKEG